MKIKSIFYLLFLVVFVSCQKVITVKLNEGTSQLAVDGFINDKRTTQIIRLTKTAPYFNNATAPAATGATVSITDDKGNTYNFTDTNGDGYYKWTPTINDTLVRLGYNYKLSIIYNSESFSASSIAFPVPPIDSIHYEYREAGTGFPAGYFPSFYARDFLGIGNFYWVRSFRNGILYSDPAQINLTQDGAFGPGVDGFTFIKPIRDNIIPFDKPLTLNDSISVEVNSINPETYFFLQQVQAQTQNGGLFATPPANVSTNIKNENSSSPVKAVGFFNIAMVATGGKKIK